MSPRPSLPGGRERILDAAQAVMAERGFHAATVRRIARAAGCAEGTVYNHFRDKHDLLRALLDRLVILQRRPLRLPMPPLGLRGLVRAYCRDRARTLGEALPLWRALLPELLVDEQLRSEYRERVVRPAIEGGVRLLRGTGAGELRGDVDVETLVRVIDGAFLGLALRWLLGDEDAALDRAERIEHVALALEAVLRGGDGEPRPGGVGATGG